MDMTKEPREEEKQDMSDSANPRAESLEDSAAAAPVGSDVDGGGGGTGDSNMNDSRRAKRRLDNHHDYDEEDRKWMEDSSGVETEKKVNSMEDGDWARKDTRHDEERVPKKQRSSNHSSSAGPYIAGTAAAAAAGNSRHHEEPAYHSMPPQPSSSGAVAGTGGGGGRPRVEADWLTTKTTKPWYICRYFGDQKCSRGEECTFVHVQKPWGSLMDTEWRHIHDKTLPMSMKYFQDHLFIESKESGGRRWFTAGFSSVFEQGRVPKKHQNIFYAEGGGSAMTEQGVHWYPTKDEAVEALKRVCTFSFWAYEQGIDRGISPRYDVVPVRNRDVSRNSGSGSFSRSGGGADPSDGPSPPARQQAESWDRYDQRPLAEDFRNETRESGRDELARGLDDRDGRRFDAETDERAYRGGSDDRRPSAAGVGGYADDDVDGARPDMTGDRRGGPQEREPMEMQATHGNDAYDAHPASDRPTNTSNSRPPASALPPLAADWLVAKTTKPFFVCRHFPKNRCFAGDDCSYVHVHPPFGQLMESEWKNVTERSLPMSLEHFQEHLYIVADRDTMGGRWYTAGFSSALSRGKQSKGQNIFHAESGDSVINQEGVHWYSTEEDAIEALKRVCVFAFWAYDQGIHPFHPGQSNKPGIGSGESVPTTHQESVWQQQRAPDEPFKTDPRIYRKGEQPLVKAAEADERAYQGSESGYFAGPRRSDSPADGRRPLDDGPGAYADEVEPQPAAMTVDPQQREPESMQAYDTTHASSDHPANNRPLPSALPRLAADWLTTKTTYPRNLCRHFWKNRCFGRDQCTFVHVHPPFGAAMESQWGSVEDKSLPMSNSFFREHLYIVDREDSTGTHWWTAGFSSALSRGKESKNQNIFYAESGESGTNEEGVNWYSTQEDAVEAVKRVCAFASWAQSKAMDVKPSAGSEVPSGLQERETSPNQGVPFNSHPTVSDPRAVRRSDPDAMSQGERPRSRGYSDVDSKRHEGTDIHPSRQERESMSSYGRSFEETEFPSRGAADRMPSATNNERSFQPNLNRRPSFEDRRRRNDMREGGSYAETGRRHSAASAPRSHPQQSMPNRRTSFDGNRSPTRGEDYPCRPEQQRFSHNDESFDNNFRRNDFNRDDRPSAKGGGGGPTTNYNRRSDNQGGSAPAFDTNDNGRGRRPHR